MHKSAILFVLVSVCAISVFAQTPYLVKDLGNYGAPAEPQWSLPNSFLASGSLLFFTATTEASGLEPWVRDGSGTRLLRDINAGPGDSAILSFVELTPGVVLFAANDGNNGAQLWRSDGTEAGTALLKIVNGTTDLFATFFGDSGKVFFAVNDGVHGYEPWVTDGTAAGTQLLADTRAGSSGSTLVQFFRLGGTTRFFATGGIWTTDGMPGGTTFDVPMAYYALPAVVANNTVYFAGFDLAHGSEPWKSDGTVAGTALIKDIRSGSMSSIENNVRIAPTSSGAVFLATDGSGDRLWTTDGTAANTVSLDAFPGGGSTDVPWLYATSQGIFFRAGIDKIWRTDGTQAGTYLAASTTGIGNSPFGFVDAFSKIYFPMFTSNDARLFQFDGSQGATLVSVRPDVWVSNVAFTGGKLWFAGADATNGSELWTSDDGTTAGTHLVTNIAPDPRRSSAPERLTAAGPYLYFHPALPQELWRSDGTSGGTFEFTNVDNGLISPPPFSAITPYRGDIYYHHGHTEFYRVDGVNGGATRVAGDYNFDAMTADENYLYLGPYSSVARLWRSDGTAAGTIELYDPTEPNHLRGNYDYFSVVVDGGYAWISCYHGLFRTAGTLATTRRVFSLPQNSHFSANFVAAAGAFYSAIYTSTNGSELWRSDGTAAGSFVVKDANPGAASSDPSQLTAAGRLVLYTATDPAHGTELWRSDGTADGTFMVKDIRPGAASSVPSSLVAIGGVVYFRANDGTNGIELWKSDGTEAGTVLVRDIAPGAFSSKPSWLAAADGKIWFTANDGLHGFELWSSDGSEAGTVMTGDIFPGSASSSPEQLTPAESHLFFTAITDAEGRELWAVPLTTGTVSVTGTRTSEGNSGTRALRFTITRHAVTSNAASVAYATSPGTASAGSDYLAASGTINFAAGETMKTVDVTINGDADTEGNESLFLQLSSPVGVALQNAIAAGVIEDDDPRADLAAEVLQSAYSSGGAPRALRVTNNGPSSAYGLTVTFNESPYDFTISSDGSCTNTVPAQCTIPFLQLGASQTLTIYRSTGKGLVDPANPPGRTVTVSVASSVTDPNPANNTASRMTTDNGMLLLPSALIIGTSATATFDLGTNAASATDVTLTSTAGNVVVTPATIRIEAGQRTATFTLNTSAGADKTLLTATIASQIQASLVLPVVANGQSPLLDVAIVADNKTSYAYGESFTIPVLVAARYPDGTLPAGSVTLLDQNGATLSQLTLDAGGAATFTRPTLAPGQYSYRIRYDGNARFNAVTVSLPAVTIQKATPTVTIYAPGGSCSNPVEVRVVVSGAAGTPAPTGTVTFSGSGSGTYTLAPNGVAGQSELTANVNVAYGDSRALIAQYSGDAIFATGQRFKSFSNGCAMNLVSTATSPTGVSLSWTSPTPATFGYAVHRATSIDGPYTFITNSQYLAAFDSTAQPGRIYFYIVYAFPGFDGTYYTSNVDIASTFTYTDSPLTEGALIKSAHLSELRTMVAALRSAAGQPELAFSGSVGPGSVIEARHFTELRDSINASRARIGVTPINWTQPNAAAGGLILAATLQELRGAAN